ncbi:MAG: LPS export ABC transporter periplasmic protein LptC [Alphaproteobacteria bacterium]|jgi:lipopolysaccharide export system protein LptC|nr:LPS export ABC transporter periplasmic protein LptC [Alphaproteobacteria bacterium]
MKPPRFRNALRPTDAVPGPATVTAASAAARGWDRFAPRRLAGAASRRYSRFVALMKIALPLAALAVLALVALWPGPERPVTSAALPDGLDGEGRGQMMSPRITGIDAHDRPYSIVGESAEQSLTGGERVVFNAPQAEITLANGAWLALMAEQGEIDQDRGRLILSGAVSLFRDDGYAFVTEEVHVDLEQTVAWGDFPVEAYGPAGEVAAEGFRLDGERNIIVFLGNSRLVLHDGPPGQVL